MPAPQEFDYSNLYLIEAETAVVLKCGESISCLIVKVGFKRLFVIYKYWGGGEHFTHPNYNFRSRKLVMKMNTYENIIEKFQKVLFLQ